MSNRRKNLHHRIVNIASHLKFQLKFNDLSGEENADLFVDQIVPSPEGTSSSTCDYNEEEKGTIDKESEGQFKVYKFMRTLVRHT